MEYLIPEIRRYPTLSGLPRICRMRISKQEVAHGFSGAHPSLWESLCRQGTTFEVMQPPFSLLADSLSTAFTDAHGNIYVAKNSSAEESEIFNAFSWGREWLSCEGGFVRRILDIHNSLREDRRGFRRLPIGTQIDAHGDTRIYPPASRIEHQLSRLYRYLHYAEEPAILKATVSFIAIVTAHPFYDGNGRVARIIFNAMIRSLSDVMFLYIPIKTLEILSGPGLILKIRRAQLFGHWAPIINFFCNSAELVRNENSKFAPPSSNEHEPNMSPSRSGRKLPR